MSEKNPTEQLLGEMYKSVKMGCENIIGVMPKVEDRFMRGVLTERLEEFGGYAKRVSDMMHERGWTPKEPGMGVKMSAKMGIAANTLIDSTPSHIAEMFIKGSEMGITKLEKLQSELSGACEGKAVSLCNEIISSEKRDNRKMEEFL